MANYVGDEDCEAGNHKWSKYSSTMCGNVKQIQEAGEDVFCYRACTHCGFEMPNSRIYTKKNIKEEEAVDFDTEQKKLRDALLLKYPIKK